MSLRSVFKAQYGAVTEEPYVTAPADSLRADLQRKRQGKTAYGTIGDRFLDNPVEIMGLLGLGLTGPVGAGRTLATNAVRKQAGISNKDMLRQLGMQFATNPADKFRSLVYNQILNNLGMQQAQNRQPKKD